MYRHQKINKPESKTEKWLAIYSTIECEAMVATTTGPHWILLLLLLVINVQASCEYLCTYKLAS